MAGFSTELASESFAGVAAVPSAARAAYLSGRRAPRVSFRASSRAFIRDRSVLGPSRRRYFLRTRRSPTPGFTPTLRVQVRPMSTLNLYFSGGGGQMSSHCLHLDPCQRFLARGESKFSTGRSGGSGPTTVSPLFLRTRPTPVLHGRCQ